MSVPPPRPPEVEEDEDSESLQSLAQPIQLQEQSGVQRSAQQAVWDPSIGTWVYTDPATGAQYEWNPAAQTYVPRISYEDMAKQQAAYVASVPAKATATKKRENNVPGAPVSLLDLATGNRYQKDHGESRIIEGEDGVKYVQQKVNKSIYAKGLPLDVSEDECIAFFSRAGVIKKDPDTAKEVIKLYHDEEGRLKGDALVTFFRPESVQQAFALLHEAYIRPGHKVLIEEAKFKLEPGTSVKTSRRRRGKRKRDQQAKTTNANSDDESASSADEAGDQLEEKDQGHVVHKSGENSIDKDGSEGKVDETKSSDQDGAKADTKDSKVSIPTDLKVVTKRKKKKVYDQSAELSWEEKEQKHIILRGVFDPQLAKADVHFYDVLHQDILEEVSKIGHVESVKVFERSPEGVVAVKFSTGSAAEKCISIMHNRLFDDRRISAEFYDGFSNYAVAEKDEEVQQRDKAWASWLESDE